jgi:signal transduction histidine kinase
LEPPASQSPRQESVPERRRLFTPYLIPLLLIGGVVLVAVLALIQAVDWFKRPFPGFFSYSSGLVSPMQRSQWLGHQAGLKPGDRVVRVDAVPFSDREALLTYLRERPLGAPITVEIERGKTRQTFTLAMNEFSDEDVLITFATPFSIGIVYLLMGAVLFFIKPRARPARLLLFLLSLISLFYLTTFDTNTTWTLERLWLCYPLFAGVSVHLFTVFPEEWHVARRHPSLRYIGYAVAGVLVLLRQVFLDAAEGSSSLAFASTAFVTAVTIANFVILGLVWRQTSSQVTVRKVKIILAGLLVTSTLAVVWSYAARFDPDATTWDLAMLLSAPFPILMVYAVLQQNIFDVDAVFRTTAIYGLSSALVIALYFAMVAFFTLFTQQYLPFYETTLTAVVATLAVAVAFNPLRVRVQRLLSRFFFREKYDLGQAIAELTSEFSKVTEVSSLGRILTSRLQRLLRVDLALLFVRDQSVGALRLAGAAGDSPAEARDTRLAPDGPLAALLRERSRPRFLSALLDTGRVPEDDVARICGLGARLVVPLVGREVLQGLLLVGGKRFEDSFTAQDIRLLESLQTPLAIALENAVLYTERAAQERLAAVGQVASLIIHEVKNPLGVIKVSIGTIKRKLQDEASRELATVIEEEVDRMNRTTAKILAFARPQQVQAEPCDLNEAVRRTLALVGLDFERAGIALAVDLDRSASPVPADSEQIQQLLLNLLLNAKAACPREGGRVSVRTRRGRDWRLGTSLGRQHFEISVEDNGVGMDAETQAKIFTPFFSTQRGGTGLGLAIVRQIVEAHHGEIRVRSEPGKGSCFTVLLPT